MAGRGSPACARATSSARPPSTTSAPATRANAAEFHARAAEHAARALRPRRRARPCRQGAGLARGPRGRPTANLRWRLLRVREQTLELQARRARTGAPTSRRSSSSPTPRRRRLAARLRGMAAQPSGAAHGRLGRVRERCARRHRRAGDGGRGARPQAACAAPALDRRGRCRATSKPAERSPSRGWAKRASAACASNEALSPQRARDRREPEGDVVGTLEHDAAEPADLPRARRPPERGGLALEPRRRLAQPRRPGAGPARFRRGACACCAPTATASSKA